MNYLRRYLILCSLTFGVIATAFAQKPVIKDVVRGGGSMNQIVSIKGLNFGTDKTKLIVSFGPAEATIISATDQLIEVFVPASATYNFVTVTRLQGPPGLTGISSEQFLLSFGGAHPFSTANLEAQKDFPAEKGLYDICTCDFDGDKDLDIATANKESTYITIVKNASTPGTISFLAPTLISLGAKTLQTRCGDLNGDGLADLVVTGGDVGNQLFILQNLGGSFSIQTIAMDLSGVLNVRIGDLDLDGKPDLVISHSDNTTLQGKMWILQNQTVSNTIAFGAPVSYLVPGAASTDGVDIADLDGDLYPEIVTSQRQVNTSNLYVIKNGSSPGTLTMGATTKIAIKGAVIHIRAADMNNDSYLDLVVTQVLNNTVSILPNTSTLSNFTFGTPVSFATEVSPWGLDLGDLDGDGKADIVVTSVAKNNLTILNNESSGSTLSFAQVLQPTTSITRHLAVGDIDGDGKPDIAFTTIDDATLIKQRVSVFRNKACMIPQIKPDSTIALCLGSSFNMFSNVSGGATYTWTNTVTNTTVGTNSPIFAIPTASVGTSKYTVTVSPQAGGISCPTPSQEVTVNITNGTGNTPTFLSPTGPVCVGSSLNLAIKNDGYQYTWTGPNGYKGTGPTPASVPNFQSINAGRYVVTVLDVTGVCAAQQASIVVEAIDAQDYEVSLGGSALTCAASQTLSVAPAPGTATYQWFEKTAGDKSGATASTYAVSNTGEYGVKVSLPGCDPVSTATLKITFATPPVPAFTSNPTGSACVSQDITFTNQTTNDAQVGTDQVQYTWSFGDGTSSDKNPVHKYLTANTYNVTLKATYLNSDAPCVVTSAPQSFNIVTAPVPVITTPSGNFTFCPDDSIKLEILGTFDSYLWDNGSTQNYTYANKTHIYQATVKSGTCTLNADHTATELEKLVTITAEPTEIPEGSSSQLTATGLSSYTWTPADSLSNPSIANPIATPATTTTYTVTGMDTNGCEETGTIVVTVKAGSITSKLKPSKLFSPNDDNVNPTWSIGNISEYPNCNVTIYDEKGIKIYESKKYNEHEWDGTFHGKRLPDGVYYYIIRCDGEEGKPRSGSITLIR